MSGNNALSAILLKVNIYVWIVDLGKQNKILHLAIKSLLYYTQQYLYTKCM